MRFQSGFTFLMEFARLDCPHEGCPRTALQTIGDLEQYWRSAICGLTERAGCGARAKVSPIGAVLTLGWRLRGPLPDANTDSTRAQAGAGAIRSS